MSLPEAKHLPWLLFLPRFLQDTYSASIKITPVNAQQPMIKINSFVSSSWTTLWFKWVVVCKWSIKWLCSNIIKLEKFQMPVPSFVFLPSWNCYFQTYLSFLARWASQIWKDVSFVFLSLRLKKVVRQAASLCTVCSEENTHRCKDVAFLWRTREKDKKRGKKLILCLTHLPFSNLNGYNKPPAI